MHLKNRIGRWELFLAFILPVAIALAVFMILGAYPFGDSTLLTLDMDSEYIDYYAQIHRFFRGEGSLLRSWNMGMGLDMLGLVAFYTASPFLLLVVLFPLEKITEAVLLMTLLKLGLAGLLFSSYTRYTFELKGHMNVAFSVAYSLLSYNLAYTSNLMWLDVVAFLPLVAMGAEKLLRENKCRLFFLSLIYIFITTYYISFMAGVFIFLYFTAVYFADSRYSHSFREYLAKLGRFVGSAFLAACCCAALLLPAFMNLRDGQEGMWELTITHKLTYTFTELMAKMTVGAYDSLTNSGSPNIFCTTLALLLVIVFFLSKAISGREKVIFGLFTLFMLVSFSYSALDLAWHAFEYPTWYPARYSFVFGFLLLHMGLRCVSHIEQISAKVLGVACGILLLILGLVALEQFEEVTWQQLVVTGLFALIYTILLFMAGRSGYNARVLAVFMLTVICCETYLNSFTIIDGISKQFGYTEYQSYTEYRQQYEPVVKKLQQQDQGLYRMELTKLRSANGGMGLGYRGISHYSTTTDQRLNRLLHLLGYDIGTINEVRFNTATPVTNSLLGIKYILSETPLENHYTLLDYDGQTYVYENPAVFPMAFFANEDVVGISLEGYDAFVAQNYLLSSLLGEEYDDIFTPLEVSDIKAANLQKIEAEDFTQMEKLSLLDGAKLRFIVENPQRKPAYGLIKVYKNKYFKAADTFINNREAGPYFSYRHDGVLTLGSEENINLTFNVNSDRLRYQSADFYCMDTELLAQAAKQANESAMELSYFDDRTLRGTLSAPDDGIITTTIPFDNGWRVKVDGKEIPTEAVAEVFLGVPVTQGEHTVEMVYTPAGWNTGLFLSFLGISTAVCIWVFSRRQKQK
ncbi:YfhO family protein [Oscillospiraceae bacterium MB08-C2-2]|nr:YfhO family protein [Oscillospiraceae bacterium MB08-C2-2]